jgi:hypothetical protein
MENNKIISGIYANNGSNVHVEHSPIVIGKGNEVHINDSELRQSIDNLITLFDGYKITITQNLDEINKEIDNLKGQLQKHSLNRRIILGSLTILKDLFVNIVANKYSTEIVAIASNLINIL